MWVKVVMCVAWRWRHHNCDHSEDAGVHCSRDRITQTTRTTQTTQTTLRYESTQTTQSYESTPSRPTTGMCNCYWNIIHVFSDTNGAWCFCQVQPSLASLWGEFLCKIPLCFRLCLWGGGWMNRSLQCSWTCYLTCAICHCHYNHWNLSIWFGTRSSLIHFACIGVASRRLLMPQAKGGVESRGEATQMQAKWIKLDLVWNLPRKSGSLLSINMRYSS